MNQGKIWLIGSSVCIHNRNASSLECFWHKVWGVISVLLKLLIPGGDVCVSGHDSGPVFEEQPISVIYPEGLKEGKVTLSCQARASPAASYRWVTHAPTQTHTHWMWSVLGSVYSIKCLPMKIHSSEESGTCRFWYYLLIKEGPLREKSKCKHITFVKLFIWHRPQWSIMTYLILGFLSYFMHYDRNHVNQCTFSVHIINIFLHLCVNGNFSVNRYSLVWPQLVICHLINTDQPQH